MKRFVPVLLIALLTPLAAQQPSPPAQQPEPAPTFRASTRLIVRTVTVKDRDGKPIEGLTAQDFVVTENGEPQEIAFVEYQRLQGELAPAAVAAVPALVTPAPAPSSAVPAAAATPARPADLTAPPQFTRPPDGRYRDRRLMVLFFDLSSMPLADQLRTFQASVKYVNSMMQPADLVSLVTYEGGSVRVKQDFTDNKAQLLQVIAVLAYGEDKDGDGIRDDPDPSSAFGQGDAEFNIFNTDRQLAALQTTVTMLRPFPEQKALVYFGSGLRLNGSDNTAQMRATTNAAIRANVMINTVDARGLVALAPLGDATQRSPGGVGMFSGQIAMNTMNTFQRSQDALYALAKDTGGKPFFDNNDLAVGIAQAAESLTSYYIIGFYTTHTATDGKYRNVSIKLAEGRKGDLAFRGGYYGDKEFAKLSGAERERQLEEAFMLENPITDITIALELNYFQLNRAEYFVPVAVKIPGSELALARRRGAQRTVLDFVAEVKDNYGVTIQNVKDKHDVRLSDQTAAELASRPIHYETGFTLLPGQYVIKFLARDAEAGRIGTYQTSFTVPNLNRELTRLPISSVVLSSQRVAQGEELDSAKNNAKTQVGNPLIHEGQKLIPSVTRVFSASKDLYVYLQAYERDATATQPLIAFVSFYRGELKTFETQPIAVTDGMDARSKAVPLRFSIPLSTVTPGNYDCQVTVIEPTTKKAAFWRAPIVVIK